MLTPGHLGTDGAIEVVYRMVREHPDKYFKTDQFNNEANYQAHYHGTAPEIWEQTDGTITMLVATMGTTGTLMGLSRRLKEYQSGHSNRWEWNRSWGIKFRAQEFERSVLPGNFR